MITKMHTCSVVFMGTPAFAVPALNALIKTDHRICGVFTQPGKPTGRGMVRQQSPVEQAARAVSLPVYTPTKWYGDTLTTLKTLSPDLIIVAAYGFLLPEPVLKLPPLGCINIHASLLPRWRGAAPIPKAILEGDTQTGVTLMHMDVGMDTGDMIAQKVVPILTTTTAQNLCEELAHAGANLLTETLPHLCSRTAQRQKQPSQGVTYAPKVTAEDYKIDWHQPASQIARHVRAYFPKAFCYTEDGKRFRILSCQAHDSTSNAAVGTIINESLDVVCGQGTLKLLSIQPAGKKAMSAQNILNGYKNIQTGCVLS